MKYIFDYNDPDVIARQNKAPNVSCAIEGVFYDMRNLVHKNLEMADRIEELEAKLEWQPIETAPTDREMFVVIGVTLGTGNGLTGRKKYTTDPVCVWRDANGAFARWQHVWAPTHWMPLPTAPTIKGEQP